MFRQLKLNKLIQKRCYSSNPVPGYIVLLPEIPPGTFATSDTNEVLNRNKVPSSFKIDIQKCRDGIGLVSLNFESNVWKVEELLKDPQYPLANILKDLDTADIDYAISLINIVHILQDLPNYGELIRRSTSARNLKFQSAPIYFACKELLADNPRSIFLRDHIRMGKLNGIELSPQSKSYFDRLNKEIIEARGKFKNNITAANNKFKHLVLDKNHLGDMSLSELTAIAKDKSNPKRGPWIVTLNKQVYSSFMENCPVPALRWNLWQAYCQRGTDNAFIQDRKTNSVLLEEIRGNRKKLAKLLGYNNHTEVTLESKLAANAHNVKSMIATLLVKCMPIQKQEIDRLYQFAASSGYDVALKTWDIAYWKKLERIETFGLKDLNFSFNSAFTNLLNFTSKLFSLEYEKVTESHYKVYSNSQLRGQFVIDPFKAPKKFPGSYVIRNNLFSTLILNLDPPMQGNDSCLSPQDLSILYENFGSLLQNILTPPEQPIVQDFRIPGHFLTLWLGNKEHAENVLGLEGTTLDNYLLSRKHFTATDLCNELYLSDLDLELDLSEDFWLDLVKKLWPTYHVIPLDKNDQSVCSSNLVHYGSTYYSDLYSKMLAADCYRSFVELKEPKNHVDEGARFKKSFFDAAMDTEPSEIFRQFRGRDPSPDAFLWSLGLMKLDKVEKQPS